MKKIILLATALCCCTLATAQVRIYGELKSGVETSQTRIGGNEHTAHTSLSDFGSHIGLSGSHPIGNNAPSHTGLWKWEQDTPSTVNPSDNSLRKQWRERKTQGKSYIDLERRHRQ